MNQGTVRMRDGRVWVLTSHYLTAEPIEVHMWWPVVTRFGTPVDPRGFEDGEVAYYRRGPAYLYEVRRPHGWVQLYLPDRGETKALKEEVPVPCPKVRRGIEVRWSPEGRGWEKYLKTKGWVPA